MADNIARAIAIRAKKGLDTETIKATTSEWLEQHGIDEFATLSEVSEYLNLEG